MNEREFAASILWISVWSQESLKHNDFLGETRIPLLHCTLDAMQEYTLLPSLLETNVMSLPVRSSRVLFFPPQASAQIDPSSSNAQLSFDLTFIENPKNTELGTIQVSAVQGTAIYHGKRHVDAICKGYTRACVTMRILSDHVPPL